MTDDFKTIVADTFQKNPKFAALVALPMIKIRNRMKRVFQRFDCPYEENRDRRDTDTDVQSGDPCSTFITVSLFI